MLSQLRDQLLAVWQRQSRVQRLVLIALVAVGVAAVSLFVTWASTPSYAVAFSGLSEADAGQIVEKLNADGIPYKLEANGRILVPSNKVYEVRLSMARQGLPQGGTIGFELFSGTTLGMTEFTQRVNYQRALEGELERTIGSLAAIKAVRVHIVIPERALLASDQSPTTASITLAFTPGQSVDAAQVRAITHLVASSVEGLKPENVVVVDADGNLLTIASGEGNELGQTAQSDSRRAAEAAYAASVETKVRNLLDTVLGPNKSVVKASVTLDWTQREVTSQTFDPAATALRSSQTLTETFSGDGSQVGGIPGATSNLPPLTSTTSVSGTQASLYQRYETTTNYEVTQQQSHAVVAPGQVEKLSVSVMVDVITDTQKLDSLKTVIAAAAGIDTARGDTLAVETLAFDRSYYEQQAADLAQSSQMDLYLKIGAAVGGALLLAALLWYVQRLLANLRLASAEAWPPMLMPASAEAALHAAHAAPGLGIPAPQATVAAPQSASEPEPDFDIPVAPAASPADEKLQRLIVRMAEENPTTVAEVIHMWLSEDEKSHA